MGAWVLAIVLLCAFFVREAIPSEKVPFDPSVASASAIAPATIMQEDLSPHVISFHPTVGYFDYSPELDQYGSTASGHGFGATFEATYSLSEHVGLGVNGFDYSGSGSYTPGNANLETAAVGSSGSSSVRGMAFGALLILDPFSGNGFRLPIFAGLIYQRLSSSTPTSPINSTTLNSAGYTFGFSPRFSVGFLRLEPFMIVSSPTQNAQVDCDGQDCAAIPLRMLPIFGVNLVYLPLNLSFFLDASSFIINTGSAYYSLGPSFKF